MSNLTAAYYQEPPEAQSIKSMLHIARILAIIFGIILLLAGLVYTVWVIYVYEVLCTGFGYIGVNYCGAYVTGALIFPILLIIWGVVDFLIYMNLKSIEGMVNARQYEQAKAKTLIWMILGFILGGILLGVILLIAYLKYDPLINAQRQAMGQAPPSGGYMPPPQGAPPAYAPQPGYAPAPPPPAAPAAAPAAPFCAKCGKPATYVPQYGRYYCYDDKVYV